MLQIERRTVRDWREHRGLPFCQITRKVVRFRRKDILDWLDARRVAIVSRRGGNVPLDAAVQEGGGQ
jgi:hypothetical protein